LDYHPIWANAKLATDIRRPVTGVGSGRNKSNTGMDRSGNKSNAGMGGSARHASPCMGADL
jgi:hypothetical protein